MAKIEMNISEYNNLNFTMHGRARYISKGNCKYCAERMYKLFQTYYQNFY
jgi:hypothetical protein